MSLLTVSIITIVIIVGIGVMLALIGLISALVLADEVGGRLSTFASVPDETVKRERQRRRIPLTRLRMRVNNLLSAFVSRELNLQLLSANWPITEIEYVLIRIWIAIGGFLLGWLLFRSPISGVGLGLVSYFILPLYLQRSIIRRRVKFEQQLVDVLVLLTGAVRAGYSLPQSFDFIVKEMNPPASEEFKRVQYEVNLGLPLSQALNNLSTRMGNDDLYLLVTAININAQVGGNLVTMLRSVTNTIRERVRLFGEIRALSAQQRFSAYLLTFIPFALGGLLFLLNPEYIRRLFEPGIWLCFPIGAVISVILGNIVIRKLARIDV